MAQINARGVGRLSHIVHLGVPAGAAPISLDDAMQELAQQVCTQWAQLIKSQVDAITQGTGTFDYMAGDEVRHFTIAMPAGQAPLGARDGASLANALRVLKQNDLNKLEDLKLRGTDAQILGVREVRLFVNAGPRRLAQVAYNGNGHVVLPQTLRGKFCVLKILEHGQQVHPVLPRGAPYVEGWSATDR